MDSVVIDRSNARRVPQGFTLVEVLVVLVLVSLTAIVILPRVSKPVARADPPTVDYLKRQQASAALKGVSIDVYLQGDKLYSLPTKASHSFASNERIEILKPAEPVVGPGQLLVRFRPDGSMSSSQAELRVGPRRTLLSFSSLGGFTTAQLDHE